MLVKRNNLHKTGRRYRGGRTRTQSEWCQSVSQSVLETAGQDITVLLIRRFSDINKCKGSTFTFSQVSDVSLSI